MKKLRNMNVGLKNMKNKKKSHVCAVKEAGMRLFDKSQENAIMVTWNL